MNTTWSKPTKYIVGIGLVILGIYVLYLSRPVIPLLIVAALIAVIVRPVIEWLHIRLRLPYGLAVVLVYLVLAILGPLALLLAVPAIIDAVGYVVSLDYQGIFQRIVEGLGGTLAAIQAAQLPVGIDAYVDQAIAGLLAELQQAESAPPPEPPPLETILRPLWTALTSTFNAAAGLAGAVASQVALFLFMILASIYISLGAPAYRGAFLRMLPEAYRPEIGLLLVRIIAIWNAYFRSQLTLMLVIGVVSWLGLTVLGVPGAVYLGIIAGLFEIIPSLGPILAAIPAVIVALLQGSTHFQLNPLIFAGLVILFYVLVQQLENTVIVPRILGEAVGLPPLVVITGVLVGASVAGILGALLATPVIATGREILRYVYRKLLGENPFPPEEALPEPVTRRSPDLYQRLGKWFQQLSLKGRK